MSWKPFSDRPPEEQEAMIRDLCFRTNNLTALQPYERFKCAGCNRMFPGEVKRRQILFTFADVCPTCCRTGGEKPH